MMPRNPSNRTRLLVLLALATPLACTAPDSKPAANSRETPSRPASAAGPPPDCLDRSDERNAYFGELHVHTALSLDAWTFETVANADDAYRFARGEPLVFPGERTVQLERPLDFSAVTDHASTMGELRLCTDPDSAVYDHRICRIARNEGPLDSSEDFEQFDSAMNIVMGEGVHKALRNAELCGEDFELCKAAMDTVWAEHRRAAERFQDRSSACRFTTFNGYEYTATPDLAKVHRNVIFRNEIVPERVFAWVDYPTRWDLWEQLDRECLEAGTGCDALTIPHNSNMSNGNMFVIDYRDEPLHNLTNRVTPSLIKDPSNAVFIVVRFVHVSKQGKPDHRFETAQ